MMCVLDPSKSDEALSLVTNLSDSLFDRSLEVRLRAVLMSFHVLLPIEARGWGGNAHVRHRLQGAPIKLSFLILSIN